MRTKTLLAATLVVPLLVMACDQGEKTPTASGPSQEKQAMATPSPDRTQGSSIPPDQSPAQSPAQPPAKEQSQAEKGS